MLEPANVAPMANNHTNAPQVSHWLRRVRPSLAVFVAHYHHSPLQAGAILLGIALAVTLLIGVKATNDNAIRSYSEATELLSQRADALLTPATGQATLDEAVYFRLRQAGLSQSLAVVSGKVAGQNGQFWQIEGSDLLAAITLQKSENSANNHASDHSSNSNTTTLSMDNLPLGAMLSGEPSVIMSRSLAAKVAPMGTLALDNIVLKVVTVADELGLGSAILADISLAQRLLNMQGQLSYIALFSEREQLDTLKQQLNHLGITPTLASYEQQDQGQALIALTRSFHLNLNAMSMLAFVVGLFIAYNGIRYSLMKRQKLLIQLLQQGIERKALMAALMIELTGLVMLGSALGFTLGLQLSHWLQPMVAMTLEQMYGAHLLPGLWQWTWLAQAIGLTLAAAIAACLPLYIDLTRQSLAQGANRQQHSQAHRRIHARQFALACLLLVFAAMLFPFSHTYNVSLVLLGVVAMAIPLLLPQLLHWGVGLLQPLARCPLWQYLLAETRELIAPLSLAMMAILLALSANVSMNTLVGSFEQTLKTWLETRLLADVYIRPPRQKITAVEQQLAQDPRIATLYHQWQIKAKLTALDSHPTTPITVSLLSRDKDSVRQTTAIKRAIPELWTQFFQGRYILISEPMALKQQWQVGDKLNVDVLTKLDITPPPTNDISLPSTQPSSTLTIAGIYYDHGNTQGEAIISHHLWQQAQLPAQPSSLAADFAQSPANMTQAQQDEQQSQLANDLGLSQAQMFSQRKIKQQAIALFKRTFSITLVLNSLTLLVAAIGLFSACLMLTQARQAPLARLYALGVSRRYLRFMVFMQMLIVVLITCLIALPTGALLGYVLINKITLQAFGWTIKMLWDWQAYTNAILIALSTCTLAVLLPLYWQTRQPLVASLQQETL